MRSRSRPVKIVDAAIRRLIADMIVTMRRAQGVGLAAVQVGVPLRVLVADPGTGPVVLVNPRLRRRWGSQIGPEGCLSIPGAIGSVRRALGVEVGARSVRGRPVAVRGTGLLARILQHEIDHLNGVLFLDRVPARRRRAGRGRSRAAAGVSSRAVATRARVGRGQPPVRRTVVARLGRARRTGRGDPLLQP